VTTLINVNTGIGRVEGEITDAYVKFILGLTLDQVPDEVIAATKLRLLDWLGVAVAGSSTTQVDRLLAALAGFSGSGPISVPGRGISLPLHDAVLVNATMAQALDFDSPLDSTVGPLAPVGAAVYATAQWRPCSGLELLLAFIVGYEVMAHIARPTGRLLQRRGLFANGHTAPFGVAAATGRMIGLDEERLKHAMGLAGTQAAGLRQTLGSMTKALMTGKAAMSGIMAACWAEQGYTSSVRILDGEMSFADVYVDESLEGTEKTLGEDWEILKSIMKLYPTCGGFPAAIECAIELRKTCDIDPREIDRVVAELGPQTVTSAGDPHPVGAEAGRLSAQYVLSVVLYEGTVTRSAFTDEAVARPEMQELLSKVELDPISERVTDGKVQIFMRDGRVFEHYVEWAKGTEGNPLTWDDVIAKFMANLDGTVDVDRAERIVDLVQNIESLEDASVILPLSS
jgi:2-methylcitrate dehydratase PrpD